MLPFPHAVSNYTALRITRDKVFFGKGGLHETALAVKDYIRAKHGIRSAVARDLGGSGNKFIG